MKHLMNKKKYLLLVVFIIVVILIFISTATNFGPSKSVSKYRSEINGESSARVAKWKVTGVTKKRGQSISLDAGFTASILEGSGNWFFDIENRSEVTAGINKDNSSITLRLEANGLDSYGDSINWDFLTGEDNNPIDNPINFEVYVYNTTAENLLFYQNKNDAADEISFTTYVGKSDDEKLNYKEIIKNTENVDYHKTLVFKTQEPTTPSPFTFDKKTEMVDSKLVTYYELSIPLSSLTDFTTNLGLGDNKTNICFQVVWSVETVGDSTTPSGEVKTYNANTLIEGTSSTAEYQYTIGGKYYYIDIKQKEFFDYATYTSSLGGEPRFKFDQMSIPYSQLSVAQKTQVEGYSELQTKTLTTLEEVEHLVEYLEYMQYKKFDEDNQKFLEFLRREPYLNIELQLSMKFNLTVEQVG